MEGLTYDPEDHSYRLDGVLVPSVSALVRIVAPMPWIRPSVLEPARELGTYVHELIDIFEDGDLHEPSLDEELRPYLDAWKAFRESTGLEVLAREAMVGSRKLRFAGRLDLVGRWPRKSGLSVLDIKTGTVIEGAGPQTAGYALAWNESAEGPGNYVRDRFALRLKGDGSYSLVPLRDPRDFAAFQAALVIHRWRESQ